MSRGRIADTSFLAFFPSPSAGVSIFGGLGIPKKRADFFLLLAVAFKNAPAASVARQEWGSNQGCPVFGSGVTSSADTSLKILFVRRVLACLVLQRAAGCCLQPRKKAPQPPWQSNKSSQSAACSRRDRAYFRRRHLSRASSQSCASSPVVLGFGTGKFPPERNYSKKKPNI